MKFGTIRVRDVAITAQELEQQYPDLFRAINAMPGITGWSQLQELLGDERKKTRVAVFSAIFEAMDESLEEEKHRR